MSRPGPSWSTIDKLEQARWQRLVYAHAADNDYVNALRRRLDRGGTLAAHECAELGRLAVLNGWPLPVAGRGARRRRKPRR